MFYLAKTPSWLIKLYGGSVWRLLNSEKTIYLTFDDGPHPEITRFVLSELDKYQAKATFFCIGKNVSLFPEVYKDILEKGHAVGNHTHHHLNGWKTGTADYVTDVLHARQYIHSALFRPPYGRSTRRQRETLSKLAEPFHEIMWTVLSGDFDKRISPQKCYKNVVNNVVDGSIVVFHDSEKAYERLRYSLPKVLEYFANQGYQFHKISTEIIEK